MADARARHGGAATDIADDVLRESFARLPGLQDLLRCAATCRRWRRLVADRAFLRRLGHWPDTARRPSFLAGIVSSQNAFPGGSGWRPKKKTDYCYTPPRFLSLQAGGGKRRLTFDSFFAFDDDDALFDLARPLASRRGFLLVSVWLHGDQYDLHLAVCLPPVGKRSTHLLPPPPFRGKSIIGCAILADEDGNLDHTQQKQSFQVLVIYYSNGGFVCACTYSSDTGSWNAPVPVQCCRSSDLTICGPHAGVVAKDGTVHWLFMHKTNPVYKTLNINVATSHVSLTEIPIKVDALLIPCIAGEEGRLSFVTIRGHGRVELWTEQEQYEDDNDAEHGRECNRVWRCSKLADLGRKRIDIVFFAESRGALLVGQQGIGFSIVDLKTKEKTPVHLNKEGKGYKRATRQFVGSCSSTCCRREHRWKCEHTSPVLYERDLFFSHPLASSQLGE